MRIDGQRRSDNFEDRGRGSMRAGGGAGALFHILFVLVRFLGWKKTLIIGAVVGVGYLLAPASAKSALGGGGGGGGGGTSSACAQHAQACDFSRAVLGSTEDVFRAAVAARKLPGTPPAAYREPTLVIFTNAVSTGCGHATSAVGPFYCPADERLYIDPTFYDVMERRLRAPGDFAQAYVIAHEVGHHVQNLVGTSRRSLPGETKNQTSVRVELQADCLAGVWGHSAKRTLAVTEEDLREALQAAHAIGDDALGNAQSNYTHGTSEQRMRWFRRGFDSGDGRQCDTFAVARAQL